MKRVAKALDPDSEEGRELKRVIEANLPPLYECERCHNKEPKKLRCERCDGRGFHA